MEIEIKSQPAEFMNNLPENSQVGCKKPIKLLEEIGNNLRVPYSKKIFKGIFELRVIKRQNIRLIYTFRQGRAVIFYVFFKKTQQIRQRDLYEILRRFHLL